MGNRVVLDSRGLRVSKPGFDVLTTPVANLQFDSDWSGLGYYKQGVIACNWSDFSSYRSFTLGRTFPSPPLVLMERQLSSTEFATVGFGSYGYWQDFHSYPDAANPNVTIYDFHFVDIIVTTSQLQIKSRRQYNNVNEDFTLRYTVMDYNL